jgi:hypothetical protein
MFESVEIFDVSIEKNKYVQSLKFDKKLLMKEEFIYLQNADPNEPSDILEFVDGFTHVYKKSRIALFFGIEDFIGFSKYETITEFTKERKFNPFGKNVFVIISSSSKPFFLSSKRTKKLLEDTQVVYMIEERSDIDRYQFFKDSMKIKSVFIPFFSSKDFSTIELQWLKDTFSTYIFDTKENVEDFSKAISFSSSSIKKILYSF